MTPLRWREVDGVTRREQAWLSRSRARPDARLPLRTRHPHSPRPPRRTRRPRIPSRARPMGTRTARRETPRDRLRSHRREHTLVPERRPLPGRVPATGRARGGTAATRTADHPPLVPMTRSQDRPGPPGYPLRPGLADDLAKPGASPLTPTFAGGKLAAPGPAAPGKRASSLGVYPRGAAVSRLAPAASPSRHHWDWEPGSVNGEIPHFAPHSKRPMSYEKKGRRPDRPLAWRGAQKPASFPTDRGNSRTYSFSPQCKLTPGF